MGRAVLLGICSITIIGCAAPRTEGADTAKGEVAAPATLSLASVAGRWNVRAVPETGDTTATTFVLNATADTAGWTITYPPNRDPLPVRVAVGGDSIVLETGPYQSRRRPGMQALSHDVYRLVGDRLVGYGVGRFLTPGGTEPEHRLRLEGTRAP